MFEYAIDIKNQPICVKSLHDNCGCFRCKEEREKQKEKETRKENEEKTIQSSS